MIVHHTTTYRVRYADTDKMQYMYNGNYLTLFEIGRTELLRACNLPYAELERDWYLLPVMEARVFFKKPAFYDDVLLVECTYKVELKPTILLQYRILRGDELVAEGYTLHTFVDNESRKPIRPPKVFFTAIEEYGKTHGETEEA